VDPPGVWVLAAAARRQFEPSNTAQLQRISEDPAQTSLALEESGYTAMFATTAETNTAPAASSTFARADLADGTVTGTVIGTDADGDDLIYTVTGQPASGTVDVDPETGAFTYSPTDAARLTAAQTTQTDRDTFTVTVSDGEAATNVAVSVPISPAQLGVSSPTTVGTSPTGVAVSPDGSYTYLANQGSGTVSVIDNNTGAVVSTITVGTSPTGVAISPDGSKVYVTNSGSGTVSVINTSTNKVKSTVKVGLNPTGVAVSPDSSTVYVANRTSGTVSVIITSTNTVASTISVGSSPSGVAVSPDGGKVYVTNSGSGTVSVIDAATRTVTSTVAVGSSPNSVDPGRAVGRADPAPS
jgi:YVTN family beta-propeller protein/VCBS repeat-containing protein